jgi:hypothetical protein
MLEDISQDDELGLGVLGALGMGQGLLSIRKSSRCSSFKGGDIPFLPLPFLNFLPRTIASHSSHFAAWEISTGSQVRHKIVTATQYATQKAPTPRPRSCGLSPEPHRGPRISKCLPQLAEQYAPSLLSLCLRTTMPLLTPPRPARSKPNHRFSPCQHI